MYRVHVHSKQGPEDLTVLNQEIAEPREGLLEGMDEQSTERGWFWGLLSKLVESKLADFEGFYRN